jgi:beta-phosphoglucomutase family hydrolase
MVDCPPVIPPIGFIFDMDGTMIDNMRFHTAAWVKLLAESDLEVDVEEFIRHGSGKPTHELLSEMFGDRMTEEERIQFAQKKEVLYRDIYRPHLKPIEGLTQFLTLAKARGIPLAIASSARQPNIEFILRGLELEGMFEVVIGASAVKRGKPDPEMFLLAANRLRLPPERCIVFEDAIAGIQAAGGAGMKTVVIATQLSEAEACQFPNVIAVLENYSRFLAEDCIKILANHTTSYAPPSSPA